MNLIEDIEESVERSKTARAALDRSRDLLIQLRAKCERLAKVARAAAADRHFMASDVRQALDELEEGDLWSAGL